MFFYQVDGKFTLNENICDVDGLNVVSDAMLSLPHAPNDLVYLPNNPYNPQQLFFINAAQVRGLRKWSRVPFPDLVVHICNEEELTLSSLTGFFFRVLSSHTAPT